MNKQHCGVVGAGTMGHGIAQVAAQAGFEVTLWDADSARLEAARATIQNNLEGGIRRGKLTAEERDETLARIQPGSSIGDLSGAGLVVEAIVEDLKAKQELFRELDRALDRQALLATNTSSLSVGEIARATQHPERVLGMHFFNPVHIMKLLEIVVHDRCSKASKEEALRIAAVMRKEPIVVMDSPGFASSRLGVVLGLEAMRMVEQGVATAEDIDKAMTLGYGHPMGPLKLTDLVGLDVRLAIAEYLHSRYQDDQYRPPVILKDKVASGELGKKSGQGFYRWAD